MNFLVAACLLPVAIVLLVNVAEHASNGEPAGAVTNTVALICCVVALCAQFMS